ncbi:MAG: APC family permease [Deltaproteobacteria bacterium]|jgi:amino acid transporter|nr:APC family permease [Deltaproteobacteria bacterium]
MSTDFTKNAYGQGSQDAKQLEEFGYKPQLRRVLSMWDLTVYGLLFMVIIAPHSIYGFVNADSQGMAPFVYLVGFVAMFFTALSYCCMANRFPIAGSVYSYVQHGINPHVGFVVGWLILLDYIFVPALLYLIVGVWCQDLFPQIPVMIWIVFFIIVNTLINIRGIQMTAKTDFVFFIVEIGIVLAIVIGGLMYVFDGGGAGKLTVDPFYQPERINLSFIATACSIAALNYLGFDGISTLAEETHNPGRNVSGAILISLFIIGTVFLAQTYVASLIEPDWKAVKPETAFFDITEKALGHGFRILLLVVNILAVGIANTLNAQAACSRVLFSMSRDGLLPKFLSKIHPKFQTPYAGVTFIGVLSLACAFIFTVDGLARLVNFGAISSFFMLNMAVVRFFFFKERNRDLKGFARYFLCPIIGSAILLYVWTGFDKTTQIVGFSWLAIGLVIGFVKSKGYKEVPDAFKKAFS